MIKKSRIGFVILISFLSISCSSLETPKLKNRVSKPYDISQNVDENVPEYTETFLNFEF